MPDASEKDATSRNQTHAPNRRTGRMPCTYSFTFHIFSQRKFIEVHVIASKLFYTALIKTVLLNFVYVRLTTKQEQQTLSFCML